MRLVVRGLVALIVLLAVLLLAGFPARTYLDQQHALASTSERLAILRKSNKTLEARTKELHSDAAVERVAREQYNLVRPGEEAYAILPGPAAKAAPKPAAAAKTHHHKSFLSRTLDKLSFWS
jgi:cell division protein FtsB